MQRESHYAAGIVVFRNGAEGRRYLILRSALTRRPVWEFPKGGVEVGESEREAAERELGEETGLGSEEYSMVDGFREEEQYVFTGGRGGVRRLISKRVVYFLAEAHTERVRISHEATEFRWLDYEEAQQVLRFPQKRRVLDLAEEWLNGSDEGEREGEGESAGSR
ncbi:MAG TPA: NUDIX domain-containing protein [Longimicrobiaceae bacterium]|nr:NUDIX domain-containing protein [Longimicrobiaceae bacterium]